MPEGLPLPLAYVPADTKSWPVELEGMIRYITTLEGGRHLSYNEIHRRTGIPAQYIRRILMGVKKPTFEAGLRISAVLNISPWKLLEYTRRIKMLLPKETLLKMQPSRRDPDRFKKMHEAKRLRSLLQDK